MKEWLYNRLTRYSSVGPYLLTFIAVLIASLVGEILAPFFGIIDIPLLYLLPVLIAAILWGQKPSYLASLLSVLAFDYLFVPPAFALRPTDQRDYFILAVFLIVAVATGTLATRLRSEREHLRALTSRLETAREEERTMIAREIHDELGQAMTGLKLGLVHILKKLPKNDEALIAHVRSLGRDIDSTITEIRRISTELRPGILDELGLTPALEWLVEDFGNKTKIHFHFSSQLNDVHWARNLSTALFRILQEALTNIVRHAHATHATINLKEKDGFLVMTVEDDGRGIAQHVLGNRTSLGLLGIRERALILGGEAQILTSKGKGTSLTVKIPIRGGYNQYA